MMELYQQWQTLCQNLNLNTEQTTPIYDALLSAYGETHRHYHNQNHILDVLQKFERAKPYFTVLTEVEIMEITFAIWFHDCIYDPRKIDNEEQSALYFMDAAKTMGLSRKMADNIAHLIRLTADHSQASTLQERLFVDCDLAILGSKEDRFAMYSNAIACEYDFVDEATYLKKRNHVLKSFLKQKFIFKTKLFRSQYELQARENIKQSIAQADMRVDMMQSS